MNSKRRVIIVGGGIAGPAVALSLIRAGFEPRIFEAHLRVEHVGGGFQIAPNGMRVLRELDLADEVIAAGALANGFCFRNHRGRIIGEMTTDRSGPAVTLMRDAFYRVLLDALARHGLAVEYAKRLTKIEEEGDEIVACFEDGTRATGDLLVGADGVRSCVRTAIFPEHAEPRYTGFIGIGGIVPDDAPPPPDPADARRLTFVLGPRFQFGYSRLSDRDARWGWWTHLPQEKELSRAEMAALDLKGWLDASFAGWCAPVEGFYRSSMTIIRTPIYDMAPLPAWSRRRIVLVGDAAHAMSPAAGQGASLALEDASRLARLLGDETASIAQAFGAYESSWKARAEATIRGARENDARSVKPVGRLGGWMRDAMFPLLTPMIRRSLEKQYASRPAG